MFDPKLALTAEHLRRLAVRMAVGGDPPDQVADALGVGERSVWRWVAAWRSGGDAALSTRPGQGPSAAEAVRRPGGRGAGLGAAEPDGVRTSPPSGGRPRGWRP